MAIVCFCSVGMNNAVAGLGAGGTGDIVLSDISNSVLYGVFALAGELGVGRCPVAHNQGSLAVQSPTSSA